ncbi:MAG TPA: hypothetical protein VFT23_00005, partial [Burkholderiales bacterium]|nr:hypothetical protein [Burkholderiales bacterium]
MQTHLRGAELAFAARHGSYVIGELGPLRALELHDHHPSSFEAQGLPRRLALERTQWTEFAYHVRPMARGET